MIAAFATINRRRRERAAPVVPTIIFLAGYIAIWTGFSLVATVVQWLLQKSGLLTTMMQSASYYFSAALFVAAGLFQFSPLKERCLAHCRSPDGFILTEWRDGAAGAFVMGARHGLFCLGCCGGLMLLLFAVAVMDLRWVVGLAALATAEKLLPQPKVWRLGIGIGLIAAGIGFALAALRGGIAV
jgi:predicted metal-binding membrane protein